MSLAHCIEYITECLCRRVDSGTEYADFPPEGVFANCLALFMGLILFFGIFLVADFDFRRVPPQTDEKK